MLHPEHRYGGLKKNSDSIRALIQSSKKFATADAKSSAFFEKKNTHP